MIYNKDIVSIENLLSNERITDSNLLSNSFDINCIKIRTSENNEYIVKFYEKESLEFNAIKSEGKNLTFFNDLDLTHFPKVISKSDKYLIMSFIENNKQNPSETRNDLIKAIVGIHKFCSEDYGFDFDTQVGGLRQINKKSNNWVNFYRENRLGYIFEKINKTEPMDSSINKKLERLLNNLENYIPKEPKASLLHGDLWEGNILFKDKKFKGFIDPGSFYGHSEMEVAYLRWFDPEFIDDSFLSKYDNYITLNKDYLNYEAVYQLYYSLMNVYLWDKSYIKDTKELIENLKI